MSHQAEAGTSAVNHSPTLVGTSFDRVEVNRIACRQVTEEKLCGTGSLGDALCLARKDCRVGNQEAALRVSTECVFDTVS